MNQGTDNKTFALAGPTPVVPTPAVPTAVFEALSAWSRSDGLFLMALRPDGAPAAHDSSADSFFIRYALPLVNHPSLPPAVELRHELATSAAAVRFHRLPGLLLASVPQAEKRKPAGSLVLIARDSSSADDKEIAQILPLLDIDDDWLGRVSEAVPSFTAASFNRHVRLFVGQAYDQLRLVGLEGELANVSEQLASTYEELSLIYQVSGGMRVNRGAADFFRETCTEVLRVMGTRAIGVAFHPDPLRRTDPALYGSLALPPPVLARLSEEIVRSMRVRRSALLCNDLSKDKVFSWLAGHAGKLLAVPLQRHDQILGCLYALDKEDRDFDSTDSKLLNSIATESAIYLENSRLFEDMRGLMMGLMHSLTSAVDAKDAYTCGHSERVALLSRHLAQEAGLGDQEVEQIYMAGLLHDVGKIGVPESVLQKAGKLTPEEFEQMKKHPEIGARILQDVRQISQIIPGVMHHHERFGGGGYPAGLAGENIPLMGRIICLADCFDAMTTNRTYRRALPIEVAMTEIRRCAGTQFDPALAEAFLRTPAEGYRELLSDHRQKSKRLLDAKDSRAAA